MATGTLANGALGRVTTLITAAASIVALLVALIAFFVKIANLETAVGSLQARADRIEAAMDAGTQRNSKTREDVVALQRDIIETESQLCAQDTVRNLTHAADLRVMAMLWRKAFAEEFPVSNTFYPQIGRCQMPQPRSP